MVGPCYVVHYLVSKFCYTLAEKERELVVYFNCLLMSFDN